MADPISTSFFVEHFDIVKVALTGAIGYIVWSLKKGLSSFEVTMEKLREDLSKMILQLNTLQTEHNIRTQQTSTCNIDSCIHHHRRASDVPSD